MREKSSKEREKLEGMAMYSRKGKEARNQSTGRGESLMRSERIWSQIS